MKPTFLIIVFIFLSTTAAFAQFMDTSEVNNYIRNVIRDRRPDKVTTADLQHAMLGITEVIGRNNFSNGHTKNMSGATASHDMSGQVFFVDSIGLLNFNISTASMDLPTRFYLMPDKFEFTIQSTGQSFYMNENEFAISGVNNIRIMSSLANGDDNDQFLTTDNSGNLMLKSVSGGGGGGGAAGNEGEIQFNDGTGNFSSQEKFGVYGGLIGIGTVSPYAQLHVTSDAPSESSSGDGMSAVDVLDIAGGIGGSSSATGSPGYISAGTGGGARIAGGNGGDATGSNAQSSGGGGGGITLTSGNGGYAPNPDNTVGRGGYGGNVSLTAGNGGDASGISTIPGPGGAIFISSGSGGNPYTEAGMGANGGQIDIVTGNPGWGSVTPGKSGTLRLATGSSGVPDGSTGDIYLTTGLASGTGINGNIYIGYNGSSAFEGKLGIGTGTFSSDEMVHIGGKVHTDEVLIAKYFNMSNTLTPSGTADSQGTIGDVRYDSGYVYIKTSGGWKRAALSTF